MKELHSRRNFLKTTSLFGGAALVASVFPSCIFGHTTQLLKIPLSGHVWAYASNFPPDWDSTPVLEQVFKDFKVAGLEGVELMESNLRNDSILELAGNLIGKYGIPVTGTSYYGDMWDRSQHPSILKDVELVVGRLHQLGGSTFGITVGDAGRKKSFEELDAQAEILKEILRICEQHEIQANLHNHTFEVENELHDLKGTLERVPEIKLGPDLNWLIRAGVDPVWFIDTYGSQMVYLHIRDQDAQGAWTQVVGEGVTNFPEIVKALKRVNFRGRAAIELAFEDPRQGSLEREWTESRDYVKTVFGW